MIHPAHLYTTQTLKMFWRHAKRYRPQMAALIAGVVFLTAIQTYIPLLYRDLINMLSRGMSDEIFRSAIKLVVFIFVVNALRIGLWRGINFVNNSFQPRVMRDLITTCFRYLHKHSSAFFNASFVGSLVTKVKRYERAFEMIADQVIYDMGRSFLDAGMILFILLWQYRVMGMMVLAWCAVFISFSYFYARFKLPFDMQRAAADTRITGQLADSITNNVNIKLFSNYQLENDRFSEVAQQQFRIRKKSWDLNTIGDIVQGILIIGLEFIIIYLAVQLWRKGTMGVGDIALLQMYLVRIFDKLWNTGRNVRVIFESLADANEMTEILAQPYSVEDMPRARRLEVTSGKVEFRNVSFGYYENIPVLSNFNITIAPSERVALIGPSGGGKSTIVKLLFRFYDASGGEIVIDGQPVADVTQDSLRDALALVPQEPILFHRSLMENIRYAKPDASDEEVVAAATRAHAHEFITSFPQEYHTLVGERGIKLSGGEKQRVAIARAILKDAPILVLDEATSSLDSESERYIQDALKSLMKNRTTIVIAHRLSTIMQMDRIIVVEGGNIVEEGKHRELLKAKQGVYQKLWQIQAGGFGVA